MQDSLFRVTTTFLLQLALSVIYKYIYSFIHHFSFSKHLYLPLSFSIKQPLFPSLGNSTEILEQLLQETMAGGDLLPFVSIVLVQLGYAGMNFTSMFAMHSGMHPLVLVAYRLLFATVAIAPFAYFMER